MSQQGAALRARADGGGTGVYATAGVNPATGTPGLPLLVEATRTGVTQLPHAAQFVGHVEVSGDLIVVGGAKSAAVVTQDGEHRRVYCTEMPEAWLEDAGEAELVDGVAEVTIDERLAAIADVEDYQVFLSPYAPVRAYVSRRDAGSFEIRLAGKKRPQKKPVACGWRLLARRRDVTAERFAPYVPVAATVTTAGEPAPLERLDLDHPIVEPHPRLRCRRRWQPAAACAGASAHARTAAGGWPRRGAWGGSRRAVGIVRKDGQRDDRSSCRAALGRTCRVVLVFGYRRRDEIARLLSSVKLLGGIEFTFRVQLDDAIDKRAPNTVSDADRTRVLRRATRDVATTVGARILWVDNTPDGNLPERNCCVRWGHDRPGA